jgi:hypothetical protein
MMTLIEKIKTLYPQLVDHDFLFKIKLQNDGDGDYIAKWEHPTLARPTEEQLA